MLSRVYSRSLSNLVTPGARLAVAGCRSMASKAQAPAPPQQAPKVHHQPNPAGTKPGFNFEIAQTKLPLKLYSKSGVIASQLYARAEFADKAEVDKVYKSLSDLFNEITAHPQASQLVLQPIESPAVKKAFLGYLVKALNVHPLVAEFTNELVDTNKIGQLPHVVRDFTSLIEARDHIVRVTVVLASPDQPKPKQQTIRKLLNYGPEAQITMNIKYNPAIVGGAVVSSEDRFIDLSFQKELETLRHSLEKKEASERATKRAEFERALAHYREQGALL